MHYLSLGSGANGSILLSITLSIISNTTCGIGSEICVTILFAWSDVFTCVVCGWEYSIQKIYVEQKIWKSTVCYRVLSYYNPLFSEPIQISIKWMLNVIHTEINEITERAVK